MKLGDWLDERTGFRAALRAALDEPVPGGARWSYVFGSVATFLLVVQAVTGVLLESGYAASVKDAWASVAYLEDQVAAGWVVRGLHAAGASALVIVVGLHLLQVTVWGAYRRPREVTWWVGLALMGCLLAFALTGYLLPWDQKGYWATQVATSLVGATPAVGPWLKRLVQGGAEYGNLTLTRFHALHVLVLPAVTLVLVVVHVKLFRKHGVTPGWRTPADAPAAPFWPDQLLRDLGAMALVLALMGLSVWRTHGAGLEAPADPASAYDARPEWYFLPLYQLLKYFPGALEIVAAIGVPVLVGGALVALPLWDRGPSRDPRARKRFIGVVVAIGLGAGALGALAALEDARDPGYRQSRVRAQKDAERARRLARLGVPPEGGVAVFENDPLARARRVFAERCAGCHVYEGRGERKAPDLDGWSSRAWLRAFLKDPEGERFYGATGHRGMEPVRETGADLDALVEFLFSQGGAAGVDPEKAARGARRVADGECTDCHTLDGSGGGGVPDLKDRASAAWIRAFLEDPSAPRFFGAKSQMPKFRGRLSDAELDALVAWLRAERERADLSQ